MPHSATPIGTQILGHSVRTFPVIDSTNSVLKAEAELGKVTEGAIITAEHQTTGHGRLNRTWESPPGKGLLFSILLYPKLPENRLTLIGLMASLGVYDGILKHLNWTNNQKTLALKWPNDLLTDGKKICGILSEGGIDNQKRRFVIVGIGVNVNQNETDFAPSIQHIASSLKLITGQEQSRDDLLKSILTSMESYYLKLQNEGSQWIAPEWFKRADIMNKKVTVTHNNQKQSGVAVGIAEDGALRIKNDQGELITVYSGDVE